MRPETETQLAEMIKMAKGPCRVRGGGTRTPGRSNGEVIETGGLSGISLYEPGALTLVAKAGTPLAEIETALQAEGQRLAFEPSDYRGLLGTTGIPTIGGVVAANASGPRRVQAGACRDFMLGVRFVDGAGTILKNGGRVMKNVTGYDLVKLMSGSWGTLGVLSEVSLKVLPKPDSAACIVLNGLSDTSAIAAMCKALGSPYEVTGAAHAPLGPDGHPVTMLRIEGFADSVNYRAQQLRNMFSGHDIAVKRDAVRVSEMWTWVRDVEMMHGQPGDVWRISTKPTDAPGIAARLGARALLYDWGGGLIWALLPEETDARARLGEFDGYATLVRASDPTQSSLPVFHPQPAPLARISSALRARFDPRGILNPGLMGT